MDSQPPAPLADFRSHTRNNSYTYSLTFSDNASARNSMDLIEGTTHSLHQGSSIREPINAHTQRQRWDALFEPQYSFGSFVHGSNQSMENNEEHKRMIDRLIDDGNHLLEHRSPRLSARPSYDAASASRSSTPTAGIMTPSLPSLDKTKTIDKETWGPQDEKTLIDRLELLKKIRAQPTELQQEELSQHGSNEQQATTARWKQQLAKKAKQFCKEAQVDRESITSSNSSDLSIEKKTAHQDEEAATGPKKICCRRSFLCFMFGFLFPPLWLFGAFYISSYAQRQSSANNRVDHIWRRRSRIAFGIFTITLMIILVIVFVLKPETVGWRLSKNNPPI